MYAGSGADAAAARSSISSAAAVRRVKRAPKSDGRYMRQCSGACGGRATMPRSMQAERALRIDALIFDLDNTLWDVVPVILRAEQLLGEFLGRAYPRILERHTLASMRELRVLVAAEQPAMQHDFTWLRLETLRRLARETGYAESMADEAFEVFYRARNDVVLYD